MEIGELLQYYMLNTVITTFQMLVVALVHSRLDYGNGALAGAPVHLMYCLQSVLNASARLI